MQHGQFQSQAKDCWKQWDFWAILILLGTIFFLKFANTQLGSDDIRWLDGEVPTVFDRYRVISQISFIMINAFFGASPEAALAIIFSFHLLNTILLYLFTKQLLANETAARIAAAVFLINPITLGTLTWISCLSYVQGTTFALASLIAFWHGATSLRIRWLVVALILYGLGLFCSHEMFFLPMIFLFLGWLRGNTAFRFGIGLCATGMAVAIVVNAVHYNFGRYGLDSPGLTDTTFLTAFASSLVSLGPILAVAFPLSFAFRTLDFLMSFFAEPVRWAITLTLLAGGILLYRPKQAWRLWLVLTASFMALIAPYVVRLYTMSVVVDYHPTYMLTGRVFYMVFFVVAIGWGEFIVRFIGDGIRTTRLLGVIALAGYLYATFFLYDWMYFRGLTVIQEAVDVPPTWNPYTNDHSTWLIFAAVILFTALAARFALYRRRDLHIRREKREYS